MFDSWWGFLHKHIIFVAFGMVRKDCFENKILPKNDRKNGKLISINVLEFIMVMIAWNTGGWTTHTQCPVLLNVADNTSAV